MAEATPLDRLYFHVSSVRAGARVWPRVSMEGRDRVTKMFTRTHCNTVLSVCLRADLHFNVKPWLKSANVRFSTRQVAISCIASLLFARANNYLKTLAARDCVLVGFYVPLVQTVFCTNNWCLYGQSKGFAAVEVLTAYSTPCHTDTVINICMDSTNSQSAPAISGGAVHIAHEYPRGVHSGLWEQGVCVVFFLHPYAWI